jgi:hypothetical protein
MSRHLRQFRSGQSLVEFAVVALVLYMLLAAILTFGHALYVAQGLQGAVDLAAREISRAPLPPDETFEDVLDSGVLGPGDQNIFDDDFLVFDLNSLGDQNFFTDIVPTWPRLNQQLATLMIVDRPDFDGDGLADANLIRYPGALLEDSSTPTGYTVGIPLVESRSTTGVESIRWIPVVEEIDTEDSPADDSGSNPDPFRASSNAGGVVALRINYPFQSASMSSFRRTTVDPYDPAIGSPNVANDGGVVELNPADRPGALVGQPLKSDGIYAGTYGGEYGLGAQGAMGMTVRPYRRVISSQAIYRREVFSN